MRFNQLFSVVLGFVIFLSTANCCFAAIFANDLVQFFFDGKLIKENSIISISNFEQDYEIYDVCERGTFAISQGPQWSSGPYKFILSDNNNLLSFEKWIINNAPIQPEDEQKAYRQYLEQYFNSESKSIIITLPTVDESPAINPKPRRSPPPGMTGGVLGFNRYFKVSFDEKSFDQIESFIYLPSENKHQAKAKEDLPEPPSLIWHVFILMFAILVLVKMVLSMQKRRRKKTSDKKIVLLFVMVLITNNSFAITEDQAVEKIILKRESGFTESIEEKVNVYLKKFPESRRLHRIKGLILFEKGYYEKSAVSFENSIHLDKHIKSDDAFFFLLKSDLMAGSCKTKILKTLKMIKERFASEPHKIAQSASILIDAGQFSTAFDYLVSLIENNNDFAWLYHFKLGQLYYQAEEMEDALGQFLRSWEMNKEFAPTLLYLGRVWEVKGNYDYALSFYIHSIEAGLEQQEAQRLKERIELIHKKLLISNNEN